MGIYEHPLTVTEAEVDFLKHVNNLCYLSWMIDAAVAHSATVGWPTRRYLELGAGWVVRSHTIEYLSPAFLGDDLVVKTWVAELKKVRSLRKYEIRRPSDDQLLAQSETLWTFVKFDTQSPTRVPEEVASSFTIVGDSGEFS